MFELDFSTDFAHMLVRFLISVVVNWFIIDRLYYVRSRRRDFYFTFMLISIAIFFLVFFMIFVLEDMKGKTGIGIGIGLFGIFSIMRYRTDTMPVREMTYLFVLISLSVVNALGSTLSLVELIVTNIIVIFAFWICEKRLGIQHIKLVQYDRIELVKPEREEELKADLEQRLGLNIKKIEVGGIDFLRDTAILKVYYLSESQRTNGADAILKMPKPALFTLLAIFLSLPAMAQSDTESGLWASAEVQKKLNKQWSLSAEAEYRLRENFGSTDRWTLSASAAYKPVKWLKLDAGYKFLRVLNDDETTWKDNGVDPNKWTPAWCCTKHRLFASATVSLKPGRIEFSLRERWQYTYRPETTVDRYDIDDDEWETKTKDGKAQHVLRSRLQAEYDIPKCKVDPYASVECYHAKGGLQKIRYTAGADWKLTKQHVLGAFYRYVDSHDDDPNLHVVGLGYKYKF